MSAMVTPYRDRAAQRQCHSLPTGFPGRATGRGRLTDCSPLTPLAALAPQLIAHHTTSFTCKLHRRGIMIFVRYYFVSTFFINHSTRKEEKYNMPVVVAKMILADLLIYILLSTNLYVISWRSQSRKFSLFLIEKKANSNCNVFLLFSTKER